MIRHVIDEIRLSGLERRNSRRIFSDLAEDYFLDICLAAPIIIVACKNEIAAALVTHILVRTCPDRILIQLIAVFVTGRFAQNKSILQAVEKNRQGLLGHEDNRLVVWCLELRDI